MKKKIFTEAIMKSNKNFKIFVSGHKGMVGSSIIRNLLNKGYKNIIVADKKKLDLTNQIDVIRFMKKHRFDHVYISAAKVGGILANMYQPAEFIYDNLMISSNLIHSSYISNVKKVMFFGSSCIYPKKNKLPIKENSLLSGYLEKTNLPYAIAKIAGLIMCGSYNTQYKKTIFKSVMPTNLYGPNDKYHKTDSHVIPSLIYKFYFAKQKKKSIVKLLGTGKAKRDFLFVDDLTNFSIDYLNDRSQVTKKDFDFVNVGSGNEISILKLAKIIKNVVGFNGKVEFDHKYPDGHKSKILNNNLSKKLGFKVKTGLNEGIKISYLDFLKQIKERKIF